MPKIQLVVLDWAGTSVDHGCFAPVASFVQAFAAFGVEVTNAEVRVPMGLHKKDHIRELFRMPDVTARWKAAQGADWNETDVEKVFQTFIPLQLDAVEDHCELVPGLLDSVGWLRDRGVRIGGTTGYFREAAERASKVAAAKGYAPDLSMCPDDGVPQGRPAPWMIFRIMERLNVYPPSSVIKVGDTVPDMEEARNAGVWALGVTDTGSEIGMTEPEWTALSETEKDKRRSGVAEVLRAAGAQEVINSVRQLPELVEHIEAK